jgi:predicted GNAT superfamily acetyltransferase
VTVRRIIDADDAEVVTQLSDDIWGSGVMVPTNLLRAVAMAGTPALVAERDGHAIGFALGFPALGDGYTYVHSHQVGVLAEHRAEHVGFALKMAQRADCLAAGVKEMRWTFDPMLRTHARFNLIHLGVKVVEFIEHCYGSRVDNFNAGDRTDRFKVCWNLERDVLDQDDCLPSEGDEVVVIPADYHQLRQEDPAAARATRLQVGAHLRDVFESGKSIAGFGPAGYVVKGSHS